MPDHIAKGEEAPTKLMLAVFRRLSRDPSILALTSDEIKFQKQGVSKHKGAGMPCQGCSACKSPSWQFKTLVVPNLLCMCCESVLHMLHFVHVQICSRLLYLKSVGS